MLICANQEDLIPRLSPHLVCNWPYSCKDDAEGYAICWGLCCLSSSLPVGLHEGSPISASNLASMLQRSSCFLGHTAWVILYHCLFFPCGFIVCYEYKYQLASARCTRVRKKKEEGDMIEILVNPQEVIRTGAHGSERMVSVCFCLHLPWDLSEMRLSRHMAHTLCLKSLSLSLFWHTAFRSSSLHDISTGINLIFPR